MYEKLILTNFQPYRKFELELDAAVTTFVGPSDSGKSSCLRALRWASLNLPTGARFVRRGGKPSRQCISEILVDGHSVIRKRASKINLYLLDGVELPAFNTSIPDDVSKILNVGDVNFQRQLDLHYWFSDTPGQVSKALNKIVNLEVIDHTLANAASYIRDVRVEIKVCQERLASARVERDRHQWAVEVNEKLTELEGKQTILQALHQKRGALATLVQQGRSHARTVQTGQTAQETGVRGLAAAEKAETLGRRRQTIYTLVQECRSLVAIRDRGRSLSFEGLDAIHSKYQALVQQRTLIKNLLLEARNLESLKCRREKSATQIRDSLKIETKGMCPLCDQPLPKEDK